MELPIEVTTMPMQLEEKIVDETNEVIAKMGYSIKFNKDELVEMLQMYINQPLKFEELEKGMWVWSNINKRYLKVCDKKIIVGVKQLIESNVDGYTCYITFTPNDFYRYGVKDD